jgi:transposase
VDRGAVPPRPAAGELHPARPERELRELVRYRTSLIRERASQINRLAKMLEGANISSAR